MEASTLLPALRHEEVPVQRVILVAMPFFSIRFPPVGISILKPGLRRLGIHCDIAYLNVPFAERIGLDRYDQICNTHTQTAMVGEWLFAQAHFGSRLPPASAYLEHLAPYFYCTTLTPQDLLDLRDEVPAFLDYCMTAVDWAGYDVIGFSTSCEQNMPAIALAARLKDRWPEKIIVFGGANCEGEMGLELHRAFPCIDFVCSGEADHSFPELLGRLAAGRPAEGIPGVIVRAGGLSCISEEAAPVTDLDRLPFPDYDDYFAALDASSLTRSVSAGVPMETSRGCWWGKKHHCTFCGLKDSTMVYRSKSQPRALAELRHLVERYHPAQVQVVDNILDLHYFDHLVPELKRLQLGVQLFYETKANLRKEQVRLLAEAGITWLQPGIETLSSHVLQLMDKGVTGLQNVQLLKWCARYGIYPTWNLLTGFPGETDEDYEGLLATMARITHLTPPEGFANFALYRFAPYFTRAERYGIENVRPEQTYHYIYPFPDTVLINLGYYLQFDYAEGVRPSTAYTARLAAAVDEWKLLGAQGTEVLHCYSPAPGKLYIEDRRRYSAPASFTFTGVQKEIYEFCDRIQGFEAIYDHARRACPDLPLRRRDVKEFLDQAVSLGLMLEERGRYLSLAVSLDAEEPAGSRPDARPIELLPMLEEHAGRVVPAGMV